MDCWGGVVSDVEPPLGTGTFTDVEVANSETVCGVTTAGAVECAEREESWTLPAIDGMTGVTAIAMSEGYAIDGGGVVADACAVFTDGHVECSFLNFPAGDFAQVEMSAQSKGACALTRDGLITCECRSGIAADICEVP